MFQLEPKNIDFASAAEGLVQTALRACAPSLLMTRVPPGMQKAGAELCLKAMSPTSRKKLVQVDRRDTVWNAVRQYFQPILSALARIRTIRVDGSGRVDVVPELQSLARDVHLLALASRHSAQLEMDLEWNRRFVAAALQDTEFLRETEAAARLAVLHGVFACFSVEVKVPTLGVAPRDESRFRDAIEEILEDAYLLEASALRRFLCFEANKAALRRDIRMLLKAVTKRKWASGLLKVTEDASLAPFKGGEALLSLLESIGSVMTKGPVIIPKPSRPWSRPANDKDARVWITPARFLHPETEALITAWGWQYEYD